MLRTSFVEIGRLAPEKILKGSYHICEWRPSCHVTKTPRTNFRSPNTQNLALIGQVVSEKMFEIVDGRTPDHGYTISSPMSLRLRWANK